MTLVIDASVASKWVLAEEGQEAAETLLLREGDRVAPDFLLIEIGNILPTKLMRRLIGLKQMREGFVFVKSCMHRFVPNGTLTQRAFEIAADCDHSVYDCMYLACAEQERSLVATADRRFFNKLQVTPYSRLLHPLIA